MKSQKSRGLFGLAIALLLCISTALADEEGVVALKFDSWRHGKFSGKIYWKIADNKLSAWVTKGLDDANPPEPVSLYLSEGDIGTISNEPSLKAFSIDVTVFADSKYKPYTDGKEFIHINLTEPRAVITDGNQTATRKISDIDYSRSTYKGNDKNKPIILHNQGSEYLKFVEPLKPKA